MRDLLAEIFQRLFDVEELRDDLSPESVSKWNSFSHIELILELEKAFGRPISTSDAVQLTSVGEIAQYLSQSR